MSYADLRTRFAEKYKGDIKDPVLNILLDTIDAFQKDVQEKLLLSAYSSWSRDIPDGLFEVLRRNLFGQMFPGPVFTVAQAALRDVKTAEPVLLEQFHHFSLQDAEGNKNLFTPQNKTWIIPAFTNDVLIDSDGSTLKLGFKILPDNLPDADDAFISIFADNADPLILERIRCRIALLCGFVESGREKPSVFRSTYPGIYNLNDDFFQTPYQNRFINIPFSLFKKAAKSMSGGTLWLSLEELGHVKEQLDKKLTINSFTVWNMAGREMLVSSGDQFRYVLTGLNMFRNETLITSVSDIGHDPAVEYIDSSTVMDPGYPFQYTSTANNRKDAMILAVTPAPAGDLKIQYKQYDLSDLCVDIPAGKPFALLKGLDERLRSVQSIVATSRNEALNDKKRIWDYFNSLVASRNRWLTKEDLRAAVHTFPPFGSISDIIVFDKISYEEKVGRVKGFITPFTEIIIPIRSEDLLKKPDKAYFERELGLYLKSRAVNGNFLRVKFVSYSDRNS